ncbi:hypothetical protein V8D89_007868 [Ganoderma adspersum]
MLFTLTGAFVVLEATLRVAAQSPLTIYTLSSPTACEPVQFTWSGGKGPFYLSLIPAGQPSAPAMLQFPVQEGTTMTWLVDMPAGTRFSSALKDSTGAMAYSDSQTVQSGPDTSCIEGSPDPIPVANAASTGTSQASSVAASNAAAAPNAVAAAAPSVKPAVAQASSAAGPSLQSAQATGTPSVVRPSVATSGSGTQQSPTSVAPVNLPTRNGAGATEGSFGLVGFIGFLGAALLW